MSASDCRKTAQVGEIQSVRAKIVSCRAFSCLWDNSVRENCQLADMVNVAFTNRTQTGGFYCGNRDGSTSQSDKLHFISQGAFLAITSSTFTNGARSIVKFITACLFHESCSRQRVSCFATSFVPGAPVRFRFAIAVFRLNTPSASRPKNFPVTGSTDCSSASIS
jgi:hypothetical protein